MPYNSYNPISGPGFLREFHPLLSSEQIYPSGTPRYGVSLAFQTCPISPPMLCYFMLGFTLSLCSPLRLGTKKSTSDSLNKFFPPLGMFMWLEQGILRGLGIFIPQVRDTPVNTTDITQDSDNPLLQRN